MKNKFDLFRIILSKNYGVKVNAFVEDFVEKK